MAMTPSNVLNIALCAALKLDPTRVRSFTITAKAHEVVTVEVEQLMPVEDSDALLAVLKRYTLTPIDKE